MTRLFVVTSVLIASAVAVLVAADGAVPGADLEVPAWEAASIRGGQCGAYQLISNGACTNSGSDSCTSVSSSCNGLCPYGCAATSSYGGSGGTFTGSLVAGPGCSFATQATCTATFCSVMGGSVPCCQCMGDSDITCGPEPFDVDPHGCSS
jgi:hypothetical protein